MESPDDFARSLERLHRSAVLRFCLGYLGSEAEAEDAVQDVFARALEVEERPQNLRVWLYTVARNHCLNLLRTRARRPADPLGAPGARPRPVQIRNRHVLPHDRCPWCTTEPAAWRGEYSVIRFFARIGRALGGRIGSL